MNSDEIQKTLVDIEGESDPTLKHLKLAGLVTAVFQDENIALVIVGGSAIEFYTEGAYVSGDIDLCIASSPAPITSRIRQQLMGRLNATGGPRSWQVAGLFVDVLGEFENLATTSIRRLNSPTGEVKLSPVEELIVERVLVSKYPKDYPPARDCAKKLLAVALQNEVETDWNEVRRLASSSAYDNWNDVQQLTNEQAQALKVRSPYDPDE